MRPAPPERTTDQRRATVVRTICDALGLTPFAGAAAETPIDDVWLTTTDAPTPSWGSIKLIYRQGVAPTAGPLLR